MNILYIALLFIILQFFIFAYVIFHFFNVKYQRKNKKIWSTKDDNRESQRWRGIMGAKMTPDQILEGPTYCLLKSCISMYDPWPYCSEIASCNSRHGPNSSLKKKLTGNGIMPITAKDDYVIYNNAIFKMMKTQSWDPFSTELSPKST